MTGVDSKTGTGKTGKPWKLSIFTDAEGREFSTFDGSVASQAQALIGKLIEVEFEETQNGQYTRRQIASVTEAAEGAKPTPVPGGKGDFRSKEQIIRTSALELAVTAFGIVGQDPVTSTDELFSLAYVYSRFIEEGDLDIEAAQA